MFHWRKEMERLDVSARKVRRLYRSLSDIQVALPGLPSQEATAYLCAWEMGENFGIAVVLHLHISRRLAVYCHEPEKIPKEDVARVLNEGIHFAESMGFLLGDLDIQLLNPRQRLDRWDSLPLKGGDAARTPSPAEPAETLPAEQAERAEEAEEAEEVEEVSTDLESNLASRSAALLRKQPITPEEVETRRKKLLENLGRFLASF
jgi:hypothetical protein